MSDKPAPGHPLPPAKVQAYADNNGVPPGDALRALRRHLEVTSYHIGKDRLFELVDAALGAQEAAAPVAPIDIEQMLAACLPGGTSCDPQEVADAIRAYAAPLVAPLAAPVAPIAEELAALGRSSITTKSGPEGMVLELYFKDVDDLIRAEVAVKWLQRAAPLAAGEGAAVTDAMVTAYLEANTAYWKRIDAEPTKLGVWRNGTPEEATRYSLMAALGDPSGAPSSAVQRPDGTTEQGAKVKVTDEMVSRFLCWRLPEDFGPDAGISFERIYNEASPYGPSFHEPTGTNLLTATQARAMLEHVLGASTTASETPHEAPEPDPQKGGRVGHVLG